MLGPTPNTTNLVGGIHFLLLKPITKLQSSKQCGALVLTDVWAHRMCESSFMLFILMPDNLTEERMVFLIKGVGITRYPHARISGVFVSYRTQKIIKRSKWKRQNYKT